MKHAFSMLVYLSGLIVASLCVTSLSMAQATDQPFAPFASIQAAPRTPYIQGNWWDITGNPEIGELGTARQEPVDFGIWQAADGTWQLWGCIRNTAVPRHKRLLYGWEGKRLTDTSWTPTGIKLLPPNEGATVQAPFVILDGPTYKMVYSDMFNEAIYLKTSPESDGKSFDEPGRILFSDSSEYHLRDPVIIKIFSTYYCYYTAHPDTTGAVYCRTSRDLQTWSPSKVVSRGGAGGAGTFDAESPFVFFYRGWYYLFRTRDANDPSAWKTYVYASTDPLDFGLDNDSKLVATLPCAAVEVVSDMGNSYIAAFGARKQSYRLARLGWR